MSTVDVKIEAAEFSTAHSRCLLRWADVEQELFKLFRTLNRSPDERISSGVFFSVISFDAKLAMIDGAAIFALEKTPLLDEWKKLSSKVSKRSRKRNSIVHAQFVVQSGEKNGKPVWEFRLRQNLFDHRKILAGVRGKDWFNVAELNRQRVSFEDMALKIHTFTEQVVAHLANRPGVLTRASTIE